MKFNYDMMKMLEKVWWAEVQGRLPFQSKSRQIKSLEAKGLIERMTVYISGCTVEGWQPTHSGRYHYCTWASRRVSKFEG